MELTMVKASTIESPKGLRTMGRGRMAVKAALTRPLPALAARWLSADSRLVAFGAVLFWLRYSAGIGILETLE